MSPKILLKCTYRLEQVFARSTSGIFATDLVHFSVDFPDLQEYTYGMGFEFSLGWAFAGLVMIAIGVAFLRFHQIVADNLGAGMADYEHYKLYALLAIVVGFLTMLNIIPLLLHLAVETLFGGGTNSTY